MWMMESLDIDKKLAADLMAFLDDDDSGAKTGRPSCSCLLIYGFRVSFVHELT